MPPILTGCGAVLSRTRRQNVGFDMPRMAAASTSRRRGSSCSNFMLDLGDLLRPDPNTSETVASTNTMAQTALAGRALPVQWSAHRSMSLAR